MTRSNEKGIALILALFMVLVLSTLTTSLMFVSQTETWSSQNYKLMSQARYGGESGIHKTANYLMFTYQPPCAGCADSLANYDITVSPVTNLVTGNPVALTFTEADSDYPAAAVKTAFVNANAAQGQLNVNDGKVDFTTTARLIAMRPIVSAYTGTPVTLQSWELTSKGTIGGVRSAEIEVSAVLERPTIPAFSFAAFATYNGCAALSFFGGGSTDSYDSTVPLVGGVPDTDNYGGDVGTNGNLDENGAPTVINGSLSTPRAGVGNCTANNVTAATVGAGTVTEGLVQLAQPIDMPTPDAPDPMPPTTNDDFCKTCGCPVGMLFCLPSPDGATLTPLGPPVMGYTLPSMTLGNVGLGSQGLLHLNTGVYIINSLTMQALSKIIVEPGAQVIFQIAGVDQATPLTITGQGIVNDSYNPQNLQFVYNGTGEVKLAGGAETSALLYAPNAEGSFTGGADWYGAVILGKLREGGGATVHYDRNLAKWAVVAGNFMMNSFTWKKQ